MPSPPQDSPPSGPSGASGLSKGAQIALAALVVAALLGWYGYTNLGEADSFTYYKTLDELEAAGPAADGRSLRVHGYVALQSIQRDLPGKQVRFTVQNDPPHAAAAAAASSASAGKSEARLPVVYRSLETPDLFKGGAEVVVEGRLQSEGDQTVFVADNVMAKCPSKFQAKVAAGGVPGTGAEPL